MKLPHWSKTSSVLLAKQRHRIGRDEAELRGPMTQLSIGFALLNEELYLSGKQTAIITEAAGGLARL
jgi:hypothetical protein